MDITGVKLVCGDALNEADVKKAMEGQDILVCSLEGDVLTMARNIVSALKVTSVNRIIRITGMGIHHEITGPRGIMLNMYAKQRPEYIKAADLIAESSAVTTRFAVRGYRTVKMKNIVLQPRRSSLLTAMWTGQPLRSVLPI